MLNFHKGDIFFVPLFESFVTVIFGKGQHLIGYKIDVYLSLG